ncbi:Vacuolar protein sorting-associated protein 28 -like protein 2 [Babesia sp. Xinjiang]|uniref:Vacuolar protein sorting-associated protein 28 -like protein 2 n=1 Tax=Babesia sp. Xinjiang TaxID=462227 RepID=UPI000A252137|nr:Vacuolar protein sorting-associated protein 28 -like protein 2 [Babesia sp. Xinjiang]ORM39547.1 Vacuolar protein sorting-associated protein 28 -like protein 2 [Babesia sp. Xinjiang]
MESVQEEPDSPSSIDVERAANIYSLLQALEHLEQSFVSGDVTTKEYNEECTELLSLCHIIEEATPNVFEKIAKEYDVKCPLALNRLKRGAPASSTMKQQSSKNNETYLMFELSEHFITLVDALKLGCSLVEEVGTLSLILKYRSQLYPLIHELVASLSCLQKLLSESGNSQAATSALEKLGEWRSKLEKMAAYDKLEETDRRQLAMDTEAAYGALKVSLRMQG